MKYKSSSILGKKKKNSFFFSPGGQGKFGLGGGWMGVGRWGVISEKRDEPCYSRLWYKE